MEEKYAKIKKIPFNLCSLTLEEVQDPVCLKSGHIFDIKNIVPYITKYKKNPISGEKLEISDLIKITFF